MIIVNGFQLLTIIRKLSILDVAAALDPPLYIGHVVSSLLTWKKHLYNRQEMFEVSNGGVKRPVMPL